MSSGTRSHSSAADFNPLAPDGSYTLNLAEHVDRAVAMQLCSIDEASDNDFMKNIKHDGRNSESVTCQLLSQL